MVFTILRAPAAHVWRSRPVGAFHMHKYVPINDEVTTMEGARMPQVGIASLNPGE